MLHIHSCCHILHLNTFCIYTKIEWKPKYDKDEMEQSKIEVETRIVVSDNSLCHAGLRGLRQRARE